MGTIFHKTHNARISYFYQSSFLVIHSLFIENQERARHWARQWGWISEWCLAKFSDFSVSLLTMFESAGCSFVAPGFCLPAWAFVLTIPYPQGHTHLLFGSQHVFFPGHWYLGLPHCLHTLHLVRQSPLPHFPQLWIGLAAMPNAPSEHWD